MRVSATSQRQHTQDRYSPLTASGPSVAEQARQIQREFLTSLRMHARATNRTGYSLAASQSTTPNLSQEDVAHRMEISSRYYGDLERGVGRWSEELVVRFERAVGLDRDGRPSIAVRDVLWNLLLGHGPRSSTPVVTAADRLHINRQHNPAFMISPRWDLLHRNDAMATWVPGLTVGTNVMVWLVSPEAAKRLVRWEEDWVRPALARLRAVYYGSLNTDTKLAHELIEVITETCDSSKIARRLWEQDANYFLERPHGSIKQLVHPTEHEKTVLIWSSRSMTSDDTRYVSLHEIHHSD